MPRIRKKASGQAGEVNINLTPMIDATFQLIIFFILTTTFVKAELAQISVPDPLEPYVPAEEGKAPPGMILLQAVSQADVPDNPENVWANAGKSGKLSHYQLGLKKFDIQNVNTDLVEEIKRRKQELTKAGAKEFRVQIRADRRLRARDVQPLMFAAYLAEIYDMDIKTTRD
jgi:biopolymer transport protein ExbD